MGEINPHLGDLELSFEATTWRVGPTYNLGADVRQYVCMLTRIDAFSLWRNNARLFVGADRTVKPTGNWNDVKQEIREHVGKWISLKEDTEKQKPDVSEEEDDEVD